MKNLSTKQKVGKVLLVLVSLGLIFGSIGMIVMNPNSREAVEMAPLHLGNYLQILGIIKFLVGVFLLFPKTRRFAALVGTGYLGGAIMATFTIGQFPFFAGSFLVLLWASMELLTCNFLGFCCCKDCRNESKVCETCNAK